MLILAQFVIVILAMLMGVRYGGLALGFWGAFGLLLLTIFFGVVPTSPPIDVILIILAACMCAGCMDVSGGLEYLVRIAARIIRSNPKYVSIIAPIVSFFITFFAGTGNLIFAIHPVIYEVAYSAKVRPERPIASATVAAQVGITACPISAATAALVGLFAQYNHPEVALGDILMVTFPACLVAVIAASFVCMFVGKELEEDPVYLARLKAGKVAPPTPVSDAPLKPGAKISVLIFLIAVLCIVMAGFFPELRTVPGATKPISMSLCIEGMMLAAGAVMCLVCNPDMNKVASSPTLKAGIVSIGACFGIAWLADSFIAANRDFFLEFAGQLAAQTPFLFAFVLFLMSGLLTSQGATTRAIMPLGLTLGISPTYLIAMFPAVNGVFLLPTTGPALSGIGFDQSGTTHIGKFLLNHSFQLLGCLMVIFAVMVGFAIVTIF